MQSKGNVLFSGSKKLLGFGIQFQRVLFIALLVFYLATMSCNGGHLGFSIDMKNTF
jgi:hypothetical protein